MVRSWQFGILLVSALLAVGCPAPPQETSKTDGDGGEETTPEGGGANLPAWTEEGNIYFFPTQTNPPTLDPVLASDTTSSAIIEQIFDTLLALDDDLNLAPNLATEWSVDPDGLTYHFTLTDKATFHNGRKVTAADVAWSIQRAAHPDSLCKRYEWVSAIEGAAAVHEKTAETVSGVVVKDDTHLDIKLHTPNAVFPYTLTMSVFAVVPKEAFPAGYGDQSFTNNPVGSGPFKFVHWNANQNILLQRYDTYWGKKPALDGILYKVIKENRQQFEEYKLGNLHHCWMEPTSVKPQVVGDATLEAQVKRYPLASLMYYGFHMDLAPFGVPADQKGNAQAQKKAKLLRKAVCYAIDRDYITRDIMRDQGVPYNKIIPPGMGSYVNATIADDYMYNPEKATALLEEAGYPNGEGLPPINLWFNKEGSHPDIAAAIQNDLKKIGMGVELRNMEWASYIEALDAGEAQFYRMGWVQDYPDPDNWLNILFNSKYKGAQGNHAFYDNPEVDALLNRALTLTDMAERNALYQQAEAIILDDAPWVVIEHGINEVLVKPEVKGMVFTAMDSADTLNHQNFENVSIR